MMTTPKQINRILSLDPASKTGWSLYDASTEILSGVQQIKQERNESPGMRFLRFRGWLREFGERLDMIVFEKPHLRGFAATAVLAGFQAEILARAAETGAEIMAVHTGELKKWATGSGGTKKDGMIAEAKNRGLENVIDDNHADSYLLLLYAMEKIGK